MGAQTTKYSSDLVRLIIEVYVKETDCTDTDKSQLLNME